jgi:tRNA-(ms[2]io[6]A)-hydroxylase
VRQVVRGHEPERGLDSMLVCAMIEARSCERFKLLTEECPDEELRVFYVGATRARKNLYVVHEHRARYAMRLPI